MSLTEIQLAEARQQILSLERQLEGAEEEEEELSEELEEATSSVFSPGWTETMKLVTATRSDPGQASWRNRYEEIETVL